MTALTSLSRMTQSMQSRSTTATGSCAAAGHFIDRQVFVDIAYMEKLHTSNARIYAVLDQLDAAFKPYFKIKGRAFAPPAQMDITDDIGHYKMTLEFLDTVEREEGPFMEHLAVRFR